MRDVLRVLVRAGYEVLSQGRHSRSMPYLFASLKWRSRWPHRIGRSETVAANKGIASSCVSSSRFQVPLVFAGLLLVAAMSIVLYVFCAIWNAG